MGIETALLTLGASAGTAAAVSAGVTGLGALSALKTLTSKPKSASQAVPTPEKPPQAAKTPDRAASMAANAATGSASQRGNASTLLTGASGIDPATLNLGKATLLGQ